MRQFKKIIGIVLVLALTLCSLASCDLVGGKKPEKLTEKADEALSAAPYSVDVRVKYSSDDELMKKAIESFANPTIKVQVNGESFKASLGLTKGDNQNYASFTFVNGVLYTEFSENGKVSYAEKEYTAEDKTALRDTLGAGAVISYDDFEEVEVKSSGKTSIISCQNIKADAIAAMETSLEEAIKTVFESAEVSVYKATLAIEIRDGKYNVIILTCEYFITTPTDSYSIDMEYSMKFNYEDAFEITAPSHG